jgi:hypothetical protein
MLRAATHVLQDLERWVEEIDNHCQLAKSYSSAAFRRLGLSYQRANGLATAATNGSADESGHNNHDRCALDGSVLAPTRGLLSRVFRLDWRV